MDEQSLLNVVEPEVLINELEEEIDEKRAGILKSLTITIFFAFLGILLLSWLTISYKIRQDTIQISTQNTQVATP